MRILVLSGGSRGDTQPYAALAIGFRRAGHDVRFACIPEFAPLVAGTGVEVIVNDIDLKGMLGSGQGAEMLEAGRNQLRFMVNIGRMIRPLMERDLDRLVAMCREADGLVLASTNILLGTAGVERLGVPFVAAWPMPVTPTRHAPNILAPVLPTWLPGRGVYNRMTHRAFALLRHRLMGRVHEQVFSALPAPAWMQSGPMPVLYGFSPEVFSRPPDWPEHEQVTGYWFLDAAADYQPPRELADFLGAGPAPVCVGFGSMSNRDPEDAARLVCEALERAGCRGVLVKAWGGLRATGLPDGVLALDSVPYDWLLPRVAAVVHHCGAGTTGAGLRAGVPTVGVPHFADQFFWARRVAELGAGPRPVPRRSLTAERLARAIRLALDTPSIRDRAARLRERIRQEDGVGRAVELATRHFERAGRDRPAAA